MPLVPELPEVPLVPELPDVPAGPGAPPKFISQGDKVVPVPILLLDDTIKAPLIISYDDIVAVK